MKSSPEKSSLSRWWVGLNRAYMRMQSSKYYPNSQGNRLNRQTLKERKNKETVLRVLKWNASKWKNKVFLTRLWPASVQLSRPDTVSPASWDFIDGLTLMVLFPIQKTCGTLKLKVVSHDGIREICVLFASLGWLIHGIYCKSPEPCKAVQNT